MKNLFGDDFHRIERPKAVGRYEKLYDYEAYMAKWDTEKAKTTDDTYTPEDVYQAVVEYVGSKVSLERRHIVRPFYPGGDYINEPYPENAIVIDNPPFSMSAKIVKFYMEQDIPFFLFTNGMTCFDHISKGATAVVVGGQGVIFENGAVVRCNFITNLFPDVAAMTAPELKEAIKACKSQQTQPKELTKYAYPDEVLSVSDMQTIANGGVYFDVRRDECVVVKNLDCFSSIPGGKSLFGSHLLVPRLSAEEARRKAEEARLSAEEARRKAEEARRKAEEARTIHLQLSERERKMLEKLRNKK